MKSEEPETRSFLSVNIDLMNQHKVFWLSPRVAVASLINFAFQTAHQLLQKQRERVHAAVATLRTSPSLDDSYTCNPIPKLTTGMAHRLEQQLGHLEAVHANLESCQCACHCAQTAGAGVVALLLAS
jgi:phosphosulfolactate phosphohydrolase-like enzyme